MCILTRDEILKLINSDELKIEPLDPIQVRENGLDLTLGDEFAVPSFIAVQESFLKALEHAEPETAVEVKRLVKDRKFKMYLDLSSTTEEDIADQYVIIRVKKKIVLPPGSFVLLTTREYIKLPRNVAGLCNLRSTIARHGIFIPPTVVDSGFEGTITLEVINLSPYFYYIDVGTRFLHLVLVKCLGEAEYAGFYKGQRGVKLPKSLLRDVTS